MPAKKAAAKKAAPRRRTNPDEFVTMVHPDIGKTATATRRALEGVWSKRGWKEADVANVEAEPSSEPERTGDSDPTPD